MNVSTYCKGKGKGKDLKIYLAHPRLIMEKGLAVQERLESIGMKVINPFQVIEQGQSMSEIVQQELEVIRDMDALVAIVDDVPTTGTPMEAFFAWEEGLPVFVLWLSKRLEFSWYGYIATGIFSDTVSLINGIAKCQ